MNETLIFNFLIDFNKKNITPIEKAKLLNDYMYINNYTHKQISKRFNIALKDIKATLKWLNLSEKDYKKLKKTGLSDEQIYDELKDNVQKKNNVENALTYNFLIDLKKKDISPFDRARIIQKYLDDHDISQRQLGKELSIPHNTIQDWLLWNRISNTEYNELKDCQLNDTVIYRALRNNKGEKIKNVINQAKLEHQKKCDLDLQLENTISAIRPFITKPVSTFRTRELMDELYNVLNRLLIKLEKKDKK